MSISSGQRVALALVPKITGGFSMTFSFLIILNVLRKHREERSTVYHRLMLGMSVADFVGSFMLALSTWPIPKESGVTWAIGTQETCTMQAFIGQASAAATPIYSATLSIYYLLVVRYKWNEQRMKSIEPYLHIPAITWAWSTAIIGLPMEIYNNANLWCFISPGPNGRGYAADTLRMVFFYIPIWTCAVIIAANLAVVTMHVSGVTTEAIRHSTAHLSNKKAQQIQTGNEEEDEEERSSADEDENDGETKDLELPGQPAHVDSHQQTEGGTRSNTIKMDSEEFCEPITSPVEKRRKRLEEVRKNRYAKWRSKVATQCLRYALAFYFAWLPISIVRMQQIVDEDRVVSYHLLLLSAINTPLLGFPNFLAFFFPKIVKFYKTRPGLLSFFRLFYSATRSSRGEDDATDEAIPRTSDRIQNEGSISPSQIESDLPEEPKPKHLVTHNAPLQNSGIEAPGNAEQTQPNVTRNNSNDRSKTQQQDSEQPGYYAPNVSSITMSETDFVPPPKRATTGRGGVLSGTSSITISELDPFEDGVEFNVPRLSSGTSSGDPSNPLSPDVKPTPPSRVVSGDLGNRFLNAMPESQRMSTSTLDANPRLPRHPSSVVCVEDNSQAEERQKDTSEREATTLSTTRTSMDFSPQVPPRQFSEHSQALPRKKQVQSSSMHMRQASSEEANSTDRAPGVPARLHSSYSEIEVQDDQNEEESGQPIRPASSGTRTADRPTAFRRMSSDDVPLVPARLTSEVSNSDYDPPDDQIFGGSDGDGSPRRTLSDEIPRLPAHILSEFSTGDFNFDLDELDDNSRQQQTPREPERTKVEGRQIRSRPTIYGRQNSDEPPVRPAHVLSEASEEFSAD